MVNLRERALMVAKQHLSVLIVEDDRTFRMIAYESLCNYGNYVIHKTLAETAQKALDVYPDLQPDITLLDINLPDGNGIDLIPKFLEMNPNAHIVMMTGSADKDDVHASRANGASGYVLKPFNIQKMRDAITAFERRKNNAPKIGAQQSKSIHQLVNEQPMTGDLTPEEILAKCRVLYIDDYHQHCDNAKRQLGKMGCTVDTADSLDSAWKLVSKHRYQLFFIDTDLAGTSGYKLASKILDQEYEGGLPPHLVAMANSQEEASSRKWARAGMNEVLIKPYSTQALEALMQNFAEQYQRDMQSCLIG
jgi:CheY-like chemotaxis protein